MGILELQNLQLSFALEIALALLLSIATRWD